MEIFTPQHELASSVESRKELNSFLSDRKWVIGREFENSVIAYPIEYDTVLERVHEGCFEILNGSEKGSLIELLQRYISDEETVAFCPTGNKRRELFNVKLFVARMENDVIPRIDHAKLLLPPGEYQGEWLMVLAPSDLL